MLPNGTCSIPYWGARECSSALEGGLWGKAVQIHPNTSGAKSTANKSLLKDFPSRNHVSRSQSPSAFLAGRSERSNGHIHFSLSFAALVLIFLLSVGSLCSQGTLLQGGLSHAASIPLGFAGLHNRIRKTLLQLTHSNSANFAPACRSYSSQPPIEKIWETKKTGCRVSNFHRPGGQRICQLIQDEMSVICWASLGRFTLERRRHEKERNNTLKKAFQVVMATR